MKCSLSFASKIKVYEQKRDEAGVSLHNCRVERMCRPCLMGEKIWLDGVEGAESLEVAKCRQ